MNSKSRNLKKRRDRSRAKLKKFSNCGYRLTVFKSNRHLHAQIVDDSIPSASVTVASASTLDKSIRLLNKSNCNAKMAAKLGELIGLRGKEKAITRVVFDRGGNKYQGNIKIIADEAKKMLQF